MWAKSFSAFLVLAISILPSSRAIWSCSSDEDCDIISGAVCRRGDCVCPLGQQAVLGGRACADLAPYHTSTCVEDHQCSRLSFLFECRRRNKSDSEGTCSCQPNHHYYLGRCWRTVAFGDPCTRSEECLSVIRDPNSMTCDGTCVCADGYYLRQRGECRRAGFAVGDGCVLDSDCQFENGACDPSSLSCFDRNATVTEPEEPNQVAEPNIKMASVPEADKMADTNMDPFNTATSHTTECNSTTPCEEELLECSQFGVCVCRVGYYGDGSNCFAELGSPSTEAQCAGLLAEVRDGICTCPANFFYDENMRDCVRVTRRIHESCVTDENCFTFGLAARCGPPQLWGLRSCECDPSQAVWDIDKHMCRLAVGVGEPCVEDSDCIAGELEIQCRFNGTEGYCACPDGFVEVDGLCLILGLELGEACQVSLECTGTPNNVCEEGICQCDSTGYREVDGVCLPILGGACTEDSDCQVSNSQCVVDGDTANCQCTEQYVEYEDECWPVASYISASCNVSAQCQATLGDNSACVEGQCVCTQAHHFRDGRCWQQTGLFQSCSRTSECFLGEMSERVVCRNSLCQCEFQYPFSEEFNTCTSAASVNIASFSLILITLAKLLL